jgi:hypothetical protein
MIMKKGKVRENKVIEKLGCRATIHCHVLIYITPYASLGVTLGDDSMTSS